MPTAGFSTGAASRCLGDRIVNHQGISLRVEWRPGPARGGLQDEFVVVHREQVRRTAPTKPEDWLWLDERVEGITGEIKALSEYEAHCRRLMSVPGIGPMISTAMVSAIGSGEAFDRGRDFTAWLGLIPRQYSTGGKPILGRISKRGSRYLRTLFIQAAHVLLMRPQNWDRFSFGPWLTQVAARLHKHKLAVALANKLARIAWSVLRHDRAFDAHRDRRLAV